MTDDELDAAIEEARLTASAEQKLVSLERLRSSVLSERRVLRVLTVVAIVVGMVGIGLAVGSYAIANRAQDALDVMEASRAEARIVSCESWNADTADRINGILLSVATRSSDPEAAKERVEPLLLPHRDCSDAGIEDYFDGDPATDPFVPVTIP